MIGASASSEVLGSLRGPVLHESPNGYLRSPEGNGMTGGDGVFHRFCKTHPCEASKKGLGLMSAPRPVDLLEAHHFGVELKIERAEESSHAQRKKHPS